MAGFIAIWGVNILLDTSPKIVRIRDAAGWATLRLKSQYGGPVFTGRLRQAVA